MPQSHHNTTRASLHYSRRPNTLTLEFHLFLEISWRSSRLRIALRTCNQQKTKEKLDGHDLHSPRAFVQTY